MARGKRGTARSSVLRVTHTAKPHIHKPILDTAGRFQISFEDDGFAATQNDGEVLVRYEDGSEVELMPFELDVKYEGYANAHKVASNPFGCLQICLQL